MIFRYSDDVFASKNIKLSKAKNKILIILLIFLLAYFSGYFFSKNSEAFLTAKNFIVNSPEARRELGEIIDVQLAPFGYELEFAGHSGSADFECKVIGALKKGNAYVKLKKDASGWKIISANIVVEGNNFRL